MLVLGCLRLRPPPPWPALQEMAVVEQVVEQGSDRRAVAEQFPLVFHGGGWT